MYIAIVLCVCLCVCVPRSQALLILHVAYASRMPLPGQTVAVSGTFPPLEDVCLPSLRCQPTYSSMDRDTKLIFKVPYIFLDHYYSSSGVVFSRSFECADHL